MYGTCDLYGLNFTLQKLPQVLLYSFYVAHVASVDAKRAQRGDPELVARAGPLSLGVVFALQNNLTRKKAPNIND